MCNSGVHARCFGDEFIEDIDKIWHCHACRERKLWYQYQKELNQNEKNKVWSNKKLKKQIKKKDKKLDNIACFMCNKKQGFMKYQKKFNSKQKTNWYHPFCVFMNKNYGWRKLVLMQEVMIEDQYYFAEKDSTKW